MVRRLPKPGAGVPSKYRSKAVVLDGIRFDSKKEAMRWSELKLMEASGEIEGLQRQVRWTFPIQTDTGRCYAYVADFCYVRHGRLVVEDTKGFETDVSKIKRGLMRYFHGVEVVFSPRVSRKK